MSRGVLFLLFDATIKVAMIQPVIDSAATLGVPVELMFPIGILELILLALYLIPSTSVLGVVLWTGFLGGSRRSGATRASSVWWRAGEPHSSGRGVAELGQRLCPLT